MEAKLVDVVDVLKELTEDVTLPRNVKLEVEEIIEILKDDIDLSLKVNKVLHKLEDVVDDKNLQAYSRTQMFNIIGLLESF